MHRVRSWAKTKAYGPTPLAVGSRRPSNPRAISSDAPVDSAATAPQDAGAISPTQPDKGQPATTTAASTADDSSSASPPAAPPPQAEGEGSVIGRSKYVAAVHDFYTVFRSIILSSWVNVLLVFVPVGIAVEAAGLNKTVIFAMNAIAIIPLAGLLSHATESVAKRMGDTIGALMNVTFGNAVELIIFMYVNLSRDQDKNEKRSLGEALSLSIEIALVKNEIRIVQASLLGSILANILLILGMCFLIGGLRFREQIYNSTVTQMSACLFSLSVMSLLLPTAFHASFTDSSKADSAVLKVSRGTSVILLLVYLMYLLFQLKSHAYMYESTPQHIIDEQSMPGPVAAWMDSSSSDSDSSSSSDSDSTSGSSRTAKRFKRVMKHARRRRKSSSASKDTIDSHHVHPTSTGSGAPPTPSRADSHGDDHPVSFGGIRFAVDDLEAGPHVVASEASSSHAEPFHHAYKSRKDKKDRKAKKKHRKHRRDEIPEPEPIEEKAEDVDESRRVDFALASDLEAQPVTAEAEAKKLSILRGLRPAIPKTLSQNVFTLPANEPIVAVPTSSGPIPMVRYGIRRTNSLPDRLHQTYTGVIPKAPVPVDATMARPLNVNTSDEANISQTSAIILLLVSTGLVAVCAEFMVDSIDYLTSNTSLGQTFVGLIILPIVGNAAEHVTSVTVAAKNKMDLAIGVAVGSSIQIALFVTPLVVLLGWMMDRDMSLYFTLFETVSLFVSAFIVNFLVLDGRSNYLEGALLCAAYIIIALSAYFYPDTADESSLGGNTDAATKMIRAVFGM